MAESARRDDHNVAERRGREADTDDAAADEPSAIRGDDADSSDAPVETDAQAEGEAAPEVREVPGESDEDADIAEDDADADTDADSDEADRDTEAAPESEEQLHADTLIARYRLLGGPTGYLLPWSWADLPPAETDALVELLDGFVGSYNKLWALTESDTVPPCWHHHPALAHDLAALAWAYFQAYRDPNATPELALRFQAHLPRFRERMDYWLGTDPAACRDGRHSRSWRPTAAQAAPNPRDSSEERDAVILLGVDDLGFPRGQAAPPDE